MEGEKVQIGEMLIREAHAQTVWLRRIFWLLFIIFVLIPMASIALYLAIKGFSQIVI